MTPTCGARRPEFRAFGGVGSGQTDAMAAPNILFAMMPGLRDYAFSVEQQERLAAVGTVLADGASFSDLTAPEVQEHLAVADVIVGHWGCPPLTADVLDAAPRLGLFAYAAGTVKLQVTDALWQREVRVTSAASANAVPVAEYTLASILFANKGVFSFAAREREPGVRVPLDPMRIGNVGRRVGLVGASHVGRLVIELLRPFDLTVAVYDPFLSDVEAAELGVARMELDDLCAWAELLSLHAPAIEATRHMIGAAQIAAMPDGATLVNTSRGSIVDQDALIRELTAGRISAVLDVFEPEPLPADSPLRTLPNVFLTPHVAGAAGTEMVRLAELAVEEVERWSRGEPALHPVVESDMDRIA